MTYLPLSLFRFGIAAARHKCNQEDRVHLPPGGLEDGLRVIERSFNDLGVGQLGERLSGPGRS